MRNRIFYYYVLLIFLIPGSCKKESICACGVKYPEENLPWLKTILATTFNANVYQFHFNEIEYIVISDLPGPDSMSVTYSCNGIKICENGGINPGGNMCTLENPALFWQTFDKERILIYEY